MLDEYDVDVRSTLERKLEEHDIDTDVREYERPMLTAFVPKMVDGEGWQSFKIEVPANVICTQEELDEMIDERIKELRPE
jgi:hypothetical protein